MKKLLLPLFSLILWTGAFAQEDTMFVFVGGINGAAGDSIFAGPNKWIDVPVFFQNGSPATGCSDVLYTLGINNCCFDSIDVVNCAWYYPFMYWDNKQFSNWNSNWQTDGDGCTWDSYSFYGIAEEQLPCYGPLLQTDPDGPPIHALTFRIHSADNPVFADSVVANAIGPGYDPILGYSYCANPDSGLECVLVQSFGRYVISSNHLPDQFEVTLPTECLYEDFSVAFEIRDADGDQPEVTANYGDVTYNGYTPDGEAKIFDYTLVFNIENLCGQCIDGDVIITAIDLNFPDEPVIANAGYLSFAGEITFSMNEVLYLWPGLEDLMPVYLNACGHCFCLGGFVLSIEYEAEFVDLIDVLPGDAISNGEYWNIEYDFDGPGTARFTFINDLDNEQPAEAICDIDPDEPIFNIKFLLDPEYNYDNNFRTPICFMYDSLGEGHWDYNHVSDTSSNPLDYNLWANSGCDSIPQNSENYFNLNLEGRYITIWVEGPHPWGDINLNSYPFEIGDAVLLANHIVDPYAYPFTLRQMFASDVNWDGLQATVADLVYLISEIFDHWLKVAPTDMIAEVNLRENVGGNIDVIISSMAAVGGALVYINHPGVELGIPSVDGMDIGYRDDSDIMTVLVYSLEAGSFAPGTNLLFTIPVLSDGDVSIGELSVSDSQGRLMDARIGNDIPIPHDFNLAQNFPNPFNAATSITYKLPKPQFVALDIFDLLGRKTKALVNVRQPAGMYNVIFNASELSSGIYLYRLQTEDFSETKKMILLK